MKIAIVGFGLEGQAAYEYWHTEGNEITICDQNTDVSLMDDVTSQTGPDYLRGLDQFDVVVRSPFVHPDLVKAAGVKVTSNMNEFLRVCPTRQIIGITGTKGKGTTSTLIAKMLEAAGRRVHVGGNIGIPALELLKNDIQPEDWVVLEMSSFQLIDLQRSPHIGVCLMVVPEHLDWHPDINEYTEAKSNLFRHQAEEDIAVYFAGNELAELIASHGQGRKLPYFAAPGATVSGGEIAIGNHLICKTDELKLLGRHNWQNACAAITTVWQIVPEIEPLRDVLTTFTGLEHRLELVREVGDVKYYNDSFGTTPETATVAVEAFQEPKVLILGGSDKGAKYDSLARAVAEGNVRRVILIGNQAARIQAALETAGYHDFQPGGASMTEIVATARAAAQPGDVVILSPACASFDMFRDYKDRGTQFKQAVQALA
jgi:UDP-N-acetylmuramoylalanine--D-glutamate ligase